MCHSSFINFTSFSIDPTWHAFNQSYFKFVTSELSWEEARKVCLEMKGDLASTSSEEEQTFLFKTFLEENSIGKYCMMYQCMSKKKKLIQIDLLLWNVAAN